MLTTDYHLIADKNGHTRIVPGAGGVNKSPNEKVILICFDFEVAKLAERAYRAGYEDCQL
jgi:hypothetical protein